MASKTILIILLTNFLIINSELTTEGLKHKEDQEIQEKVEDTTVLEDVKTTTDLYQEQSEREESSSNNSTPEREGNMEIVTDDSVNIVRDNETDRLGYTNSSQNIDIGSKVETITMPATTNTIEDVSLAMPSKEHSSKEQVEEPEISGSRSPKADIDPKPLEKRTFPPQTTRSIVRSWLQDWSIRPPVGLLVPLRAEALARTLAVWSDLNVPPLNLTQVLVMGYDSNGVNWRSRHNLHPTNTNSHEKTVAEALSKLLLKYQGVQTDTAVDGTMRALATAAKLVPYDSAVFVVTDQGAGDPQRLPLALRALVEKRLKVYTIWTDPNHTSPKSEDAIQELRNVSRHTEGEVIHYPLQVMDMDNSANLAAETELEQWNPIDAKIGRRGRLQSEMQVEKYDLLLVRRGGGQATSLGVPVENGVSGLRIVIEGAVEHAVLYPPNDGPQIDLYNVTSVADFSPASRTEGLSPRDVYMIFPGSQFDTDMLSVIPAHTTEPEYQAAYVGLWHLSVKCNTCDYRLCVYARAFIHFNVEADTPDSLKFRVTGPVASVRESQLVDEYGTELAKLPFSYQPMAGEEKMIEIDPIVELVADVAMPQVKATKVYAKIVGRDLKGEPFIRISGPLNQPSRLSRSASITFPDSDLERVEEYNSMVFRQQNAYNDTALPFGRATSQIVNQQGTLLTSIQIGLATRLYGSPGDRLQLHFEVTNYRDQSVRFSFGAVGELRFLTGISPTSQTIGSGQTVNVIVSLTISSSSPAGARDQIVFTAYGNEQVSISAYVYVISPTSISDVWAPELSHTFQGTCFGKTGDDCSQHAWSTTVTARDALTGILRLSSSPIGLMYNSDFVSGSRQEVIATYRATCCAPRVMINAVDAFGNANSYVIDISNYLTGAAIAAIVLGVFLVIALILLIIFLIYWCVKKRRESRELPTYNTSRS